MKKELVIRTSCHGLLDDTAR